MEAARHRLLANQVRTLKNHGRTPGMKPASTTSQPMGHNPQVVHTPPPWLPPRITPTQARRERRRRGAHLKPARSHRPEKTTADTPQRVADRETSPSGHNRDEVSFDPFMESCLSDPNTIATPAAPRFCLEPRRDYAEGTPLRVTPGTLSARLHRPGAS